MVNLTHYLWLAVTLTTFTPASDFTGRPQSVVLASDDGTTPVAWRTKFAKKVLAVQKQPPAQTLFLGNLGFEATEASIRQMLEAHHRLSKKGKEKDTGEVNKEEGEEALAIKEEPQPAAKLKDEWIRSVRLGTFEDSGLCKGFVILLTY